MRAGVTAYEAKRKTHAGRLAGLWRILLCAGLFCSLPLAAAPLAIPFAAPAASKVEAVNGSGSSKTDPDEIRSELQAARTELAAADAESAHSSETSATAEEQQLRRYLLQEIVQAYEQMLSNSSRLANIQKQADAAKKKSEAWVGFETKPPYSILFLDKLVGDLKTAQRNHQAIVSEYDSYTSFREHLVRSLQDDGAALRRKEEAQQSGNPAAPVESAAGSRANFSQSLQMMRLHVRAKTVILKELDSSSETLRLDAARALTEVGLAERQVAVARAHVAFTSEDYQTIRDELDAEGQDASSKLAKLSALPTQAGKKQKTENEVGILDTDIPVVDNVGMLDAFRLLPTVIEIKRGAWDLRYRVFNKSSPELLATASDQQRQYASTLGLFSKNVKRQLKNSEDTVGRLESLLMSAESNALKQALQVELESSMKRREQLQDTEAGINSAQFIVDQLGEELGITKASLGVTGWTQAVATSAEDVASKIWNFELFTATNTIEVDGRQITGISSITVAKLVRAITLFAIGVVIALWLGKRTEKYVVQRFGLEAARARILRKWLFTLGLFILVVAVLMWVNIPLSIFAFFGGAVAIAVGFGMQNILKNLISGLMLLFERPFKPGDIVQVGDIKGSVIEIGIRSSVIRDADGVDTLIPNSIFIEQNVRNWVYDNPKVRSVITIGVAYGSSGREVAAILDDCVRRHGLVLTDPAPMVYFDDFGADALQFSICYWLEIGPKTNGRQVASDLRFMIEKSLGEKGIGIPYPQRDVHLDTLTPLKVELTRKDKKDEKGKAR